MQAPAPRAVPGAWRGGPDTEVGRAISGMMERVRAADARVNARFSGDSIESLFTRAILDNRQVTNEQLLAMTRVGLDQLTTPEADRRWVERRFPNARELPVHQFTVGMLAAATGVDPQRLSQAAPDLGLTGSASLGLLRVPHSDDLRRSTALHDFTDFLRAAGIEGLNRAVWGAESSTRSAIISATTGGPILGGR